MCSSVLAGCTFCVSSQLDLILFVSFLALSPNIAPNGTADQISDYHDPGLFPDPDYAYFANDGDFGTNLNQDERCAITQAMAGAWWRLDLLTAFQVSAIGITTRENSGNKQILSLYQFKFSNHRYSTDLIKIVTKSMSG